MKRYLTVTSFSLIFFLSIIVISCGEKKFKIDGEISGADKELLVLEKADFNGNWLIIDSTRTSSKGSFKFSRPAFPAPEILRLSLGKNHIYIPVDSTENINVKSSAGAFGIDFELSGSVTAKNMELFEKELLALPQDISPDSLDSFKKSVFTKYMQRTPGSLTGYYILTKQVNGKPLFSPYEGDDYKYFAAVATGFQQTRPDDPRTKLLEQTGINALRERNNRLGRHREFEANEISLIEISLPDEKGAAKSLSEVAAQGKPTLLVFSLMNAEDSPALNFQLNKIREEKGNSFNIYQVSPDADRYAWREAASNLPWTTVYDSEAEYSPALAAYNVTELPAFFIIDSKGNLSARVFSLEEVKKGI